MSRILLLPCFLIALGTLGLGHSVAAQDAGALPEKFTLKFIATDPAGKPVEGALVTVAHVAKDDNPEIRGDAWSYEVGLTDSEGKLETTSDVVMEGNERWTGPLTLTFTAYKEGLAAPDHQKVLVAPGSSHDIRFKFTTGGSISGRIVDSAGAPAAGIMVAASTEAPNSSGRDIRSPGDVSRIIYYRDQLATTDTNGNYVLKGLRPGEFFVVVKSPGFSGVAPKCTVADRASVVLPEALTATRLTALKFTLSVTKKTFARLTFYDAEGRTVAKSAFSDAHGKCVVVDVPPASVRVEIEARGFKKTPGLNFKLVDGEHTDLGQIELEAE
ncbi:MAG: carboxypeptidase regulatory-like domain-containing protein [Planctomycetes bacterium]|nr:carboxypeptidase regulatory-like domain-containing protein [Planctomycetota bacterium]